MISSVSGGSYVSAYFGLYGDRIFTDVEERFLRRPVETDLAKNLLRPANWKTQGSPYFGRSDMAANYYDDVIFDHKVFHDMHRPGAPFIVINSTDLSTGSRFSFTKSQFDMICSNLENYPISRTVMSSSAVPGAATPIILQNHAGACGYELPLWLQ